MVDRGDATTRERDFADVLILTRRRALKGHCDQGTGIGDQRAIRDESRPTVLPAGVLRVGDPTGDEAGSALAPLLLYQHDRVALWVADRGEGRLAGDFERLGQDGLTEVDRLEE